MMYKCFSVLLNILFSFLFSQVFSCGPGNERDLDQLQKYLGISLEGGGKFTETEFSSSPIHLSSDLNCNFENLIGCHWANAPDDPLDQSDFFWFNKSDPRPWPIQVRPRITPDLGNHFLLTGNRQSIPHAAVWYSSPVSCQRNTGTLSFKYWLYNSAKIEVVIISAGVLPIRPLVTPSQSCDARAVDQVDCIIVVEPIAEPFQIAIRAYDLRGATGSIAIIDDINYDAQLCSALGQTVIRGIIGDAISLGGSFREIEWGNGGLTGGIIRRPDDLYCNRFDSFCRWGNSESGSIPWMRGEGYPGEKQWSRITGYIDLPTEPFLIVRDDVRIGSTSGSARLVSDPIQCLTTEGFLQFRYWMSRGGAKLRVCQIDPNTKFLFECLTAPLDQSPGPILLRFPPRNQLFQYMFEAYDLNANGNNGMVVIDEIEFSGVFCEQGPLTTAIPNIADSASINARDLGGSFRTRALPEQGKTGQNIAISTNLFCGSFDSSCRWSNANKTQRYYWKQGVGTPDRIKMQKLTGTNILPREPFAFLPFADGLPGAALLISDPIQCQTGDGVFRLKHWASEGTRLDVCVLHAGSLKEIRCESVTGASPGPASIYIPGPIHSKFVLSLWGSGQKEGLIAIDDIFYEAQLCRDQQSISKSAPRTDSSDVFEVLCNKLQCNFDAGNFCGWKRAGLPIPSAKFDLKNESIGVAGNVKIGSGTGYYLGTSLVRPAPYAVIESPEFYIEENLRLAVQYGRGTYGSELWFCKNTLPSLLTLRSGNPDNCNRLAGPLLNLREWQSHAKTHVLLTPSDTKVYLIALHDVFEYGEAAFSLDDFQLTDLNGATLCF